jgi:hypothetical protein
MHNENVNQVSTLLTLLTGILKPITGDAVASATILAADHYERIFIYCLAWSLGGLLDAKDRVLFDAQLRTLTTQAPKKVRAALAAGEYSGSHCKTAAYTTSLQGQLSSQVSAVRPRYGHFALQADSDTVYEYLVNEQTGQWQHWRERIPSWEYPRGVEKPKFTQLVIPTLDSVRYEKLLSLVHSVGKASLVSRLPYGRKCKALAECSYTCPVAVFVLCCVKYRGLLAYSGGPLRQGQLSLGLWFSFPSDDLLILAVGWWAWYGQDQHNPAVPGPLQQGGVFLQDHHVLVPHHAHDFPALCGGGYCSPHSQPRLLRQCFTASRSRPLLQP